MIPIAKPLIDDVEKKLVMDVLDSGIISIGKVVKDFEQKFAEYTGAKFAIATSSGTSALHIALAAAGVKPGDKVLTTPFSFVATANSILYCGAIPVFSDVDKDTFNMDPEQARLMLENIEGIKAILLVHLYGQSCDMDEFMKLAEEFNVIIVEDAAQAHGAKFKGKHVGTIGKAGTFSFYPTKNMTTAEGGMVTTDDPEVYKQGLLIREHGANGTYQHEMLGYNYRMTNIEAAIGIGQLGKLDGFNAARKENADYYTENLKGLEWLQIPVVKDENVHCYHQYTLKVKEGRDRFSEYLKENEIGSKVYYPITIPAQPMYKDMGYGQLNFPVADRLCEEVISIPVHPAVSVEDREKIVEVIRNYSH